MTAGSESAPLRIDFRDRRPPEVVRFQMERDLRALFEPVEAAAPRLVYRAVVHKGSVEYRFHFTFEAALLFTNRYSVTLETSKPDTSAASWFDFYTRDFQPLATSGPPAPGEGSPKRYARLAQLALSAEDSMPDVASVQRHIIEQMRAGAWFSTAHKEGGTTIRYRNGSFVCADYGESSGVRRFGDEASFLGHLRQFFDWEVSYQNYPEKAPEFTAWRLILRLLRND